ncbi:hypothetical protein, partial [Xanthomonas translucens]|uniref:hypothetical protein n=1 Tax=Xanthomonas campestris pv. translucens TaxID=343 RepID=UPI0035E88E4D
PQNKFLSLLALFLQNFALDHAGTRGIKCEDVDAPENLMILRFIWHLFCGLMVIKSPFNSNFMLSISFLHNKSTKFINERFSYLDVNFRRIYSFLG